MKAVYLVFLLLLASLSFADCIGYNDTFQVRVLDAKLRAIPDALVTVRFDRGVTGGEQYFTTTPRYTNTNGMVDFQIYNQGTNSRKIDCEITINVSKSGVSMTKVVTANVHSSIIDIQLGDTYPLRFYVRDQLGSPIPDASVSVANMTNKTNAAGYADYFLPVGNHSYFASYLDASEAGTLQVTDDSEFLVKFTYYKVTVDVSDDFGDPLPATLTIFNQTIEMENGHFESDKTFGQMVPFKVDYKGIVTEGTILPATKPDMKIIYDIHSPSITDIKAEALNSRPRLLMTMADPGKYANGIDFSTIKVVYRMEPADSTTPWDKAVAFTTGRNQVTAEFPELPANRIVRFRVEVKDKAGNKAEVEGKFTTFAGQPTQNDTGNQTTTQPTQPEGQGIPLLYIVLGVIIAVLAIYLVFRMKSKPVGGS